MSANKNTDALAGQEGTGSAEFSSKRPAEEPMMTSGHQPGQMVGNDAVSEFQAQTLPPGSAPASRTFQPNPTDDVAPVPNMRKDADVELKKAPADDTIQGATSGDVHQGLGKPVQGQSSKELHHDGEQSRNSDGKGLQGVGATATEHKTVDHRQPEHAHHRGIDKEEAVGGRSDITGATERVPEGAETVASGR